MDLLIGLVIAMFIITAVFVGYHASQNSHEEIIQGHNSLVELDLFSNSQEQIEIMSVVNQNFN
jgi:Tfp pilus assembly protein PilW